MASHPCKQPVEPKKPTAAQAINKTKGAKVGNSKKDKDKD